MDDGNRATHLGVADQLAATLMMLTRTGTVDGLDYASNFRTTVPATPYTLVSDALAPVLLTLAGGDAGRAQQLRDYVSDGSSVTSGLRYAERLWLIEDAVTAGGNAGKAHAEAHGVAEWDRTPEVPEQFAAVASYWRSAYGDALRDWDAANPPDPRYVTADGHRITDGMRVWTNNLRSGTVDFARSGVDKPHWTGWFDVHEDGRGWVLQDGARLTTRYPGTGEAPPAAPASVTQVVEGLAEEHHGRIVNRRDDGVWLTLLVDFDRHADRQAFVTALPKGVSWERDSEMSVAVDIQLV